jgi:thiamine-phosphate pyrophosphorylase
MVTCQKKSEGGDALTISVWPQKQCFCLATAQTNKQLSTGAHYSQNVCLAYSFSSYKLLTLPAYELASLGASCIFAFRSLSTLSANKPAMLQLPKLYAITDTQLSNYTHAEIVQLLLAGGATFIQLRDKDISGKELLDVARECLAMTRPVGAKLIINDRVDVALTANADGVHLGQDDLTVEEAREILGKDKIIGLSTHSLEQLQAALQTSADYLAVGPVYDTSTKENPSPVVGLELVTAAKTLTDRPLVAIGGITVERAPAVIEAGADSVAVISALYPWPKKLDLMSKPDITKQVKKFLKALSD